MDKLILRNVKLKWCYLKEPNTKGDYASNKYEITAVLTPEQAAELKSHINPKQKIKEKDGELSITLKSTVQPAVKGPDGLMYTPEQMAKIGNGTTANVRVNFYTARGMTFAGLSALKVKNLVEYSGGLSDLDDDDDGVAPFDTSSTLLDDDI